MCVIDWFKSRQKLLRMLAKARAERKLAVDTLKNQELNFLLTSIENDTLKKIIDTNGKHAVRLARSVVRK